MPEKIIFPRNENNAITAECNTDGFVPKEANDGKENNRTNETN